MGNIFTTRFLLVLVGVFAISSSLAYSLKLKDSSFEQTPQPVEQEINADALIDQALEFSVNGAYEKSFPILEHLGNKNVTRAKLYLGVAYYHGHGVPSNREKARAIFLELREKGYENGIVETYLSIIGSNDFQ